MFTISLHNIRLSAPIGLYVQEKILQNQFEVDIDLRVAHYEASHLIDYSVVASLAKEVFLQKIEILEALALELYQQIISAFPSVQQVQIKIRKLNPPIGLNTAYAQVCLVKQNNNP